MRINSLDVRAYGPFTNKQFDFSRGRGKLELIYGPNEAGKSSLLRTLSDLLFGIPGQTKDAFVHPYANLLIGATIEHEGKSLCVFRRKGTNNTLRGADEKSPIADVEFRAVVPLDNRSAFESMFGIDAGRLAEGGRELMSGQGDFGKMLFSAASGIEDFRGILAALTADAEALFKGRTSSIARRVEECRDLQKRISASLLTTNTLAELTDRRQQAEANLERLGRELHTKRVEENRLERMREALDRLGKRQVLLAGLERLRLVRVARAGFADEFARTEEGLNQKQLDRQRMVREIAGLEQEIEALVYSETLLRHEGEIAKLPERVGAERKAAADKVKLQSQALAAESRAAALCAELGIAVNMESIPALHIVAENRRRAEELDSQFAALNADRKSAARDTAKLRREIEANVERLSATPEPKPITAVQEALKLTEPIAAVALEFASRRKVAEDDERKLVAAIRELPWDGAPDSLENADLPAASLVEEWRQRMSQADSRIETARVQFEEAEEQVRQCEAAIRQQQAGRNIPTAEAMELARRHRDLGWRSVRKSWLEGIIEAGLQAKDLADTYETSVQTADNSADVLREHANEAARLFQAQIDLKNAQLRRDARASALAALRSEKDAMQPQWASLWQPWKIEPRPPAQMAAWLNKSARLIERTTRLAEVKASNRNQELLAAAAASSLKDALLSSGVPVEDSSLTGVRVGAANFIERQQTNQANRAALEAALADGRRKLESAQESAAEVEAALSEWTEQWKALLEQLHMSSDLQPAAVRATLDYRRQLSETHKEWNEKRQRIAGIEADASHFKQLVESLTSQVADDLGTLEPSAAADQLHRRLKEHARNRDLRAEKEKALGKLKFDLQHGEENLNTIRAFMDALVAEAGCTDPSQIGEYIQQSGQRARLEADLAVIDARLTEISGSGGIAALEQEAVQHSMDELPTRIEDLRRTLEQLHAERDEALRTETELKVELSRLEGRNDAAAAASDLESARANLMDESGRYVRLKLAEHVLKSAVESYRKKDSGEMLKRSSEIFSQLTLGSFEGLDLDWDDKNNPELVGVRNGSTARVKTDQLSSGTCDQLYLALRVASLEIYFRNHPPVPFIADDVLIHFDDERAGAALQVLAGLAEQTQVLLFTHHGHLLQVAQACLDPDRLAVYRIDADSSLVP
jgi:uncharacterized protein YhaN